MFIIITVDKNNRKGEIGLYYLLYMCTLTRKYEAPFYYLFFYCFVILMYESME